MKNNGGYNFRIDKTVTIYWCWVDEIIRKIRTWIYLQFMASSDVTNKLSKQCTVFLFNFFFYYFTYSLFPTVIVFKKISTNLYHRRWWKHWNIIVIIDTFLRMKKRYEYSLGAKIKRLQSDADLDENMHFCIRRRKF